MISGKEFAALLETQGYDFFSGVPCSLIESLIGVLEAHPRLPYVPAVREDVAVGLAAGAWLAGRMPMVLMQNSGLGTSLNALVSLSLMYRLPALLLVTWRGYEGKDAPEHLLMGEISPSLLTLVGIPHRVLRASSAAEDTAWARAESERLSQPVVHANGYICRESFAVSNRPQSFYMIGSMGLASAIALGVALAQPARKT